MTAPNVLQLVPRREADMRAALEARVPDLRCPMAEIVAIAARLTRYDAALLMGPCRLPGPSYARQVAMWQMRRDGYSDAEIGRFFGRDATTIRHGIGRVEAKLGGAT